MSNVVPYTTGLPPAVAGNVGDYRVIRLSGVDSLSAATAFSADVWLEGLPKTTLSVVLVSAVKRTVRVELGGVGGWLATAIPGDYLLEIDVSFGPVTKLTWPARAPMVLGVREQA